MLTNRDREVLRWLEDYKAITVCQATQMFFKGCYEGCRRRLKELEEYGVLKSYKTRLTDEKVYYIEDKLSDHDSWRYNFLKEIKRLGGNILNLDTKPSYLKDKIRPVCWMVDVIMANIVFGGIAIYIIFAIWLIDEYIISPLARGFHNKYVINKEIDKREW